MNLEDAVIEQIRDALQERGELVTFVGIKERINKMTPFELLREISDALERSGVRLEE